MNVKQMNRLIEEGEGYTILHELEHANGTGRTVMRDKSLEILHKVQSEDGPWGLLFDASIECEGMFNL